MKRADDSAFPHDVGQGTGERIISEGITIREYFAGLAMQGMLAACEGFDGTPSFQKHLTESAVKQADALIEALNKTK